MSLNWEIILEHQDQSRKAALLEGRARLAGAPADAEAEDVPFSITLYTDQISLNVPASPLSREFISSLDAILGPPRLEPTVKCSCDWGKGITGAMLIVLWDLPAPDRSRTLQTLHAFLGSTPAAEK